MLKNRRSLPTAVLLATALACLLATGARADFQESFTLEGDTLQVENLIGRIEIVAGSGRAFQVEASARGRDATREALTFDVARSGQPRLTIRFPDRERRYVYPELGRNSETTFRPDGKGGGWLGGWFGGGRIEVSGSGRGAEMWVDLTIQVPRGGSLKLDHGVGKVLARDVEGRLSLELRSGSVEVAGVRGELQVDTGSGQVRIEDVSGDLSVDTGSGSVDVARCRGDRVVIDTGSGTVTLDSVVARKLSVDTGSGGVRARGIEADNADIDTGSGGVELALDRMGSGRFRIDTGSGGIRLALPADASAQVRAETGSGGIRVDMPGIDIVRQQRDEMVFRVGGGRAQMDLSTGSGGIRIASGR